MKVNQAQESKKTRRRSPLLYFSTEVNAQNWGKAAGQAGIEIFLDFSYT